MFQADSNVCPACGFSKLFILFVLYTVQIHVSPSIFAPFFLNFGILELAFSP